MLLAINSPLLPGKDLAKAPFCPLTVSCHPERSRRVSGHSKETVGNTQRFFGCVNSAQNDRDRQYKNRCPVNSHNVLPVSLSPSPPQS